jgi:predicted helicase
MAEEKELTEEAKKERRKREKAAAKYAALGVEKFTVEVAGMFMSEMKKVMKAHGINTQQDIHQHLLKKLISADFETQTWVLRNVTTPYEITEKVLRQLRAAGLQHPKRSKPSELADSF